MWYFVCYYFIIVPRLHDVDVKYLAALSLQPIFGMNWASLLNNN